MLYTLHSSAWHSSPWSCVITRTPYLFWEFIKFNGRFAHYLVIAYAKSCKTTAMMGITHLPACRA